MERDGSVVVAVPIVAVPVLPVTVAVAEGSSGLFGRGENRDRGEGATHVDDDLPCGRRRESGRTAGRGAVDLARDEGAGGADLHAIGDDELDASEQEPSSTLSWVGASASVRLPNTATPSSHS